jgi:hypothetical protein
LKYEINRSILASGDTCKLKFLANSDSYFTSKVCRSLSKLGVLGTCSIPQFLSVYEVLCGFMLIVVSFAAYTGRGIEIKGESA